MTDNNVQSSWKKFRFNYLKPNARYFRSMRQLNCHSGFVSFLIEKCNSTSTLLFHSYHEFKIETKNLMNEIFKKHLDKCIESKTLIHFIDDRETRHESHVLTISPNLPYKSCRQASIHKQFTEMFNGKQKSVVELLWMMFADDVYINYEHNKMTARVNLFIRTNHEGNYFRIQCATWSESWRDSSIDN